jgi:hypothetical protein
MSYRKEEGSIATKKNVRKFIVCIMIFSTLILLGGCMDPATKDIDNRNIDDRTISSSDREMLCIICGVHCLDNSPIVMGIDPVIEERIKQDWQEQFDSEFSGINYFGTHNGYVAFPQFSGNTIESNIMVAGTIFRHGFENTIYLWKDGSFFEMIDSYLQGRLSAENIMAIGRVFKWRFHGCDSSVDEWYYNMDNISTIIP